MKPLFNSSVAPWIPAFAGMTMRVSLLLCVGLLLTACSNPNAAPRNLNMVVSVSTDGHYAIATNTNKQAILWNLQNHSYQIIFNDANIYSARFVPNTHDFIYQNDTTNEVIVETVAGKVLKRFNPGFPTYGELLTSNLQSWFASNDTEDVYKLNLQTGTKQLIFDSCHPNHTPLPNAQGGCGSFFGADQLLWLDFTPDQKKIIGASNGGFSISEVDSGKMLADIGGNDAQTVSAINPDGQYLVTGDIVNTGIEYNFNAN